MYVCLFLSRALSYFEQGDFSSVKDCLESQVESRLWGRDPEVVPLWDPNQLLSTSETLLLRASTLQMDISDDDDTSSTTSDDNITRYITSTYM